MLDNLISWLVESVSSAVLFIIVLLGGTPKNPRTVLGPGYSEALLLVF
ncbi:MAG TPA: hypothetical protein PKA42_01435 [Candidatus Paceibacterota bacterium]|nr:hypothetical protein [Candidatus Paceibacterota bacterium]HMO82806.1 hypothetical protein [Candidatus Paceibacterota bacterium]